MSCEKLETSKLSTFPPKQNRIFLIAVHRFDAAWKEELKINPDDPRFFHVLIQTIGYPKFFFEIFLMLRNCKKLNKI